MDKFDEEQNRTGAASAEPSVPCIAKDGDDFCGEDPRIAEAGRQIYDDAAGMATGFWDRQPDSCAPDGESEAVKLAFRGMWVARDARAMVHGRRDGAARALHAVRAAIDAAHAGLEAKKLSILSRPSQLRSAGDMLDVLDSAMAMHHEEKTALGRLHGMERELQDELAAADVAAGLAETQHDSAMRLVYEAFKDSRRAT